MIGENFRGKPRALSEYEGRITSILLVNAIIPFKDADTDERICENPKVFVQSLCSLRKPEENIHFVILAELDRDVREKHLRDFALEPQKPSLEEIWRDLQDNSKERADDLDVRKASQNPNSSEERFHFTFEVVREDIAIERIAKETIQHAIDDPGGQCEPKDIFELSVYVRDRVVVLGRNSDEVSLLKSFYIWPTEDKDSPQEHFVSRYIADMLSAGIPSINVRNSPLLMEGGDLLVGKDFALIGHRTLRENLHFHKKNNKLNTPQQILDRFAETLGVSDAYCPTYFATPAGQDEAPRSLYHIDLYLTFLGERAEMELVALGEIMTWDGCTWKRAPNDDPEQEFLDNFERLLERGLPNGRRFIVKRLPLLRHDNVLLSYNNCLVETRSGGKPCVFLPTFEQGAKPEFTAAFKEADEMTIGTLDRWGIEVVPVRYDFHNWAGASAGMRCVTQVLRRTTD